MVECKTCRRVIRKFMLGQPLNPWQSQSLVLPPASIARCKGGGQSSELLNFDHDDIEEGANVFGIRITITFIVESNLNEPIAATSERSSWEPQPRECSMLCQTRTVQRSVQQKVLVLC